MTFLSLPWNTGPVLYSHKGHRASEFAHLGYNSVYQVSFQGVSGLQETGITISGLDLFQLSSEEV